MPGEVLPAGHDRWVDLPLGGTRKLRPMDLLSIGEFARLSRLSPKALRLYDELGLVVPAQVDQATGYRLYAPEQLERARLVADLRRLGMPLATIGEIVGGGDAGGGSQLARRVKAFWTEIERAHLARRELAELLVARLEGRRTAMMPVETRSIPARSLLCLRRTVDGTTGAWALGKEFIGLFRERQAPGRLPGIAGATFCIYWGEVSDDSDGPLEWCRPVAEEEAGAAASDFPELALRTERAHQEAFVALGPAAQVDASAWAPAFESIRTWAEQHGHQPGDLGIRIVYTANGPPDEVRGPDCDLAVPLR
jgi:DNA-binding transcriptional MerR regulator